MFVSSRVKDQCTMFNQFSCRSHPSLVQQNSQDEIVKPGWTAMLHDHSSYWQVLIKPHGTTSMHTGNFFRVGSSNICGSRSTTSHKEKSRDITNSYASPQKPNTYWTNSVHVDAWNKHSSFVKHSLWWRTRWNWCFQKYKHNCSRHFQHKPYEIFSVLNKNEGLCGNYPRIFLIVGLPATVSILWQKVLLLI